MWPAARAHAATADSLTIHDCVELARAYAPSVASAKWGGRAAASDSVSVVRNHRPEWALDVRGTVAPQGFYDPTVTDLGGYQAKLGATWLLSDGGRRARARESMGLSSRAAHWQTRLAQREAGTAAAELAIRVVRLQRADSAYGAGIAWLEHLSLLVRLGVQSGTRAASDSIRVQLERDAAVAAKESAQLEAQLARLELLTLLGRDRDTILVVCEPKTPGSVTAADSVAIFEGLTRLPELQLARLSEAQGGIDASETFHRNAATLELSADAGLAGANLTQAVPPDLRAENPGATLGDRLRRDLGASVSLQLHLPIFDPGTRAAADARRFALSGARARSAAELVTQRRLAMGLLERARITARLVAAARETELRATRSLLRMKSLYMGGGATLLDLLDAWRVEQDARERIEDARQQHTFATFQMEDRQWLER